ncbi:unnamed protein product [Anisakis simplex]|uniref:GRIP domain-containing protein n=1 Tax=Anisakis simplex TaxID=6269 RepID=A0A158PPG3_ANISI|nr:unnamed protein product [Anisakis simplex]
MSDINESINKSTSEQDESEESLCDDAKQLLARKITQFPSRTPFMTHSDGALQSTSNVVSTGRSTTFSTPVLALSTNSSTIRRQYVDIQAKIDENKDLKAKVFELQKEVFLMKRELPIIKDQDGNDFTAEYLECRNKLFNEETRRMEAEEELRLMKLNMDELKRIHERQRDEWLSRNERLVEERDALNEDYLVQQNELRSNIQQISQLTAQLNNLNGQLINDDGTESQADTSLSNMSILSHRDRMIEDLKGTILEMTVKEEQMKGLMDSLNVEIGKRNEQLNEQLKALDEERAKNIQSKQMIARLEQQLKETQNAHDLLKEELMNTKKKSDVEMDKLRQCLERRDKAINALLRKQPSEMSSSLNEIPRETFTSFASEHITDDNPVVQKLLEKLAGISKVNNELKNEVRELKKAGAFDQELDTSELIVSSDDDDDESSVWDVDRMLLENKKLAADLSKFGYGDKDPKCQRSDLSTVTDLYSHSITALDNLDSLKKKVLLLRRISLRLFEKLRGSATFLQSLLDEFGQGERGRSFFKEIEAMRIEFGRSASTINEIVDDIEVTENSIVGFKAQLERSMNCTMANGSKIIDDFGKSASEHNVGSIDNQQKISQLESELMDTKTKLAEREDAHTTIQSQRLVLHDKNEEIKRLSDALRARDDEISHCKMVCSSMKLKTHGLLDSMRDLLQTSPTNELRKGSASDQSHNLDANTSSSSHHQLSSQIAQIDADINAVSADLKRIQNAFKDCEKERELAANECERLSEQMTTLQIETAEYKRVYDDVAQRKAQAKAIGTQSDLNQQDVSNAEIEEMEQITTELIKLRLKNETAEKNLQLMCQAINRLQKGVNEPNDAIAQNVRKLNVSTMTLLGGNELVDMQGRLTDYASFANKMYTLIGKWTAKESCSFSKTSFTAADLERMYQKMVRIQKISDDEILSLKTQIERVEATRDRSSCDFNTSANARRLEVLRSEMTINEVNDMYRSSHSIVELIKDMLTSTATKHSCTFGSGKQQFDENSNENNLKEEDVNDALQKARTIRSQLATLCSRLTQYEKAKENFDPFDSVLMFAQIDTLKSENVKLQLMLSDAQSMLMSSHEKLRSQPNSGAMCDAIARELGKINRAMKSITRDVSKYRKMKHGTATRARTESS